MKVIIAFLFCFALSIFIQAHSQLIVNPPATSDANSYSNTTVKALADLAQAIKPDAFIKIAVKEKSEWLNKLPAVSTPASLSQSIISFSKFIKPNKFRNTFNVSAFVKSAGNIANMKQGNEVIKRLEAGLMPESFMPMWKMQKGSWLNELND